VSALVGARVAVLALAVGFAAAPCAPAQAAAVAEATGVATTGVATTGSRSGARSGAAAGATARGDPANGARIYERCLACHALQYDRTGPRHCGLLGRKAGSVAGFDYSEAMKRSGIVWNAATLDRFLANPLGTVPGTTMGYAGIADARERADLIAYLGQAKCGGAANRGR
jgi:cytochrome c